MKKVYILVMLALGLGILFVSMARASFEIMTREDREGRLQVINLEVEVLKDNGERIKEIYKLPVSKMLPTNMFYSFKEVRGHLWLLFARSDQEKIRTTLVLADKYISESVTLVEKGFYRRASLSGEKAVEKLEYAWTLASSMGDNTTNEVKRRILPALRAYAQVVKKTGQGEALEKIEEISDKVEQGQN